jgi:hypothetical protein
MAYPADRALGPNARGLTDDSPIRAVVDELNKVITALRVLTAKLDADAANTALNDTNYSALTAELAGVASPRKLT